MTESDQDPSSSWLPPGEYEPEERVPKGQPDESGVEERAPMGQHAASGVEERPREHEPAAESAARDLPPATADATAEQEPAVEEEAVVTAEPDEAPTSRLPQFEPASDASAASPASVAAFAPSRRQTLAVGAYCRELCPPGTASAAAAESLTTFAGGDEHELLRYTRTIAARHAPVAPRRSRWHELVAAERESACQQTPGTVAALANGELSAAQGRALERHLKTCLTCQATEVRAGRASRAFAATAGIQLATDEQRPAPAEQRSSESAATSIQQPSLGSANAPQGVGK